MDNKSWISGIAEARVLTEFIKKEFDVFAQFTGKAPFDLVIHKAGKLFRVEVKSTAKRTKANTGWKVQIKKVRSNKTVNKITPFDKTACDILAVYIEPIDRVVFVDSSDIQVRSELAIFDKDLKDPNWRI